MKIASITENIDLHRGDNALRLMVESEVLLDGFTDVGVVANGLIPIMNFNDKVFAYFDTETFETHEIRKVDWISGFHYVGSNLSYSGHNYRTDPLKEVTDFYHFRMSEKVKDVFQNFDGCELTEVPEKKFDVDTQKMMETGNVTVQCKMSPQSMKRLFDLIKYYRIVGSGFLGKSLNIGAMPIKLEDGSNYISRLLALSQKNGLYGVMDVRTNKLIAEIKYKKIDIYPAAIIVDSDLRINY